MTTPNRNSIGKLLRKLAGKPAIPHIHTKKYTMNELINILNGVGFKILLKRYSLSTYLNPRKARRPHDYRDIVVSELFRTPHIENFVLTLILPVAVIIPPCSGSLVLVAQKVSKST